MAQTISEMVTEFYDTFGQPPPEGRWELKWNLIEEEMQELADEVAKWEVGRSDLESVAKEVADVAYVLWGWALEMGIDLEAAVAEVHRSNLSKAGVDGTVVRRSDGKILKGPNYQPPNMAGVLKGAA